MEAWIDPRTYKIYWTICQNAQKSNQSGRWFFEPFGMTWAALATFWFSFEPQLGPKGCQNARGGLENEPKGAWRAEDVWKGTQRDEKMSWRLPKGTLKGTKGSQKGTKGRKNGAKGEPKDAKTEPKRSDSATKCIQKTLLKNMPK